MRSLHDTLGGISPSDNDPKGAGIPIGGGGVNAECTFDVWIVHVRCPDRASSPVQLRKFNVRIAQDHGLRGEGERHPHEGRILVRGFHAARRFDHVNRGDAHPATHSPKVVLAHPFHRRHVDHELRDNDEASV